MDFSLSFDGSYSDLGRRVSPSPYRHARNFSNQSMFSVSSYASDLSSTFSSTHTLHTPATKSPKYRLEKLIKSSLKHTLKTNKSESNNIEYWNSFYKKLRRIMSTFTDDSSLCHALNEPFSGKSSTKTCSSLIHILCKQFYLYARSNNWSVAFKILDCITHFLDGGANTSIFYTKLNEPAQRNYNSIHTLYEGLQSMLSLEVITHEQFISHFCKAISAGNICNNMNSNLNNGNYNEKRINISEFNPAVLTLCFYETDIDDETQWENITYWLGDCLYNDYCVHLISPYLAKQFILMGYDMLHIALHKFDHLDFNNNEQMDLLITHEMDIQTILTKNGARSKHGNKMHSKVAAFLWFIRFGNFKKDLINIVDIGIKQLALNEFVIDAAIIEQILSYSHHLIISSSELTYIVHMNKLLYKLNLSYFDEDQWMNEAFEMIFKLDNIWIEWICTFVLPQLTKLQLKKIEQYLSQHISQKQWNKFIRRISLSDIITFSTYNILTQIEPEKMQNIIIKNYKNSQLIELLINAHYNVSKIFGCKSILYNILKDHSVDNIHKNAIINAIHFRVHENNNNNNTAMIIINDLLFGEVEWKINPIIWESIKLVFNPKYNHFCMALNDLLYKLTSIQHHGKFIFFMQNQMFDFRYCLNKGLVNVALRNLMTEKSFHKKASCIKLICEWIYKHFEIEQDHQCKQTIADISITAINSYMTNILSSYGAMKPDKDQTNIERYLYQLKAALSRNDMTNNNNNLNHNLNMNHIANKPSLLQSKRRSVPLTSHAQNNFIPLGFYYFKAEASYRKNNGTIIFAKLLKNSVFKQNQLRHQMNWDMLIDAIYLNLDASDYFIVFKALKMVADNLLRNDNKYRILYTKNKTVQQRILSRIGGCEFLLGLGFRKVTTHKLVCDNADFDFEVVATAISAINAKLASIGIKMNDKMQMQMKMQQNGHVMGENHKNNIKNINHMEGAKEIELHNNNGRNNRNMHWTSMIKIVK